MNPILEASRELQAFCEDANWSFCFIGGLAVQRWGEPRNTLGVDLTLITGFGREAPYVEKLLGSFSARRPDAGEFALRYRVLLARAANGVPLDIALGALPFEQRAVERSSVWVLPGSIRLRTCGPEDLVVFKAFAWFWTSSSRCWNSRKIALRWKSSCLCAAGYVYNAHVEIGWDPEKVRSNRKICGRLNGR